MTIICLSLSHRFVPAGVLENTGGTVEKHVRSILTKLDLPESETEHRRVLAVLRFLDAR
jgi:DNA-binding NarL/FixJ family response regulator